MNNITINIKIPTWLYKLRHLPNYLRFKIKPPKCSKCGINLLSETGVEYCWDPNNNGRTLSVCNYGVGNEHAICRNCLAEKICNFYNETKTFNYYNEKYWHNKDTYCKFCERSVNSYKIIHLSDSEWGDRLHFCTQGSWNGNYICIECAVNAIQRGQIKTGYNRNSLYINSHGLPIKDNKVLYPNW